MPMLPIVFSTEIEKEHMWQKIGYEEFFNSAQVVGIGYSILTNCKILDEKVEHVRAFHTNGHIWQLHEIFDNFTKKTNFFKPATNTNISNLRNEITFQPKFWEDFNHIQTILGLIRYALCNLLKFIL